MWMHRGREQNMFFFSFPEVATLTRFLPDHSASTCEPFHLLFIPIIIVMTMMMITIMMMTMMIIIIMIKMHRHEKVPTWCSGSVINSCREFVATIRDPNVNAKGRVIVL